MSRLSFRPRPLDINKKLPIVKSIREFEDDDAPTTGASTRNSHLLRAAAEADNEVHRVPAKKSSSEIPTPQFSVVDTYERDYARTFAQPTSYLRGRGELRLANLLSMIWTMRMRIGLKSLTMSGRFLRLKSILLYLMIISVHLFLSRFEALLFKLEVLDHKTRERAGVITPTLGSPIPVFLQLNSAIEALQSLSVRYAVFRSVHNYWKAKRERWQKPILRRLQPPPPVNDTNPYNVFRPREKAPRLHTRRMQRRENNAQSFEKLRLVRRSLGQAKTLLEALIKREEKKRDILECEVSLQRIQMKYKHGAQLVEDGTALVGSQSDSSDEDEYMDSEDATNERTNDWPSNTQSRLQNLKLRVIPPQRVKHELKQEPLPNGWLRKREAQEPVMLFTRPLDIEKLAATGISAPVGPPVEDGSAPTLRFHGRIGRGGRIIFDRFNPLLRS
ncbi:uncharacterized protein LOC109718652 isoform X3 [Ananas comosus]|uniref:Uncharacterized protein LOC109718652 isoform X3 n=1 Tax=Ananas comosus TaxID=4615 RepID=A0A6P5G4A8_ANACO|nr:uncharacterized protein LOC109718652 isoform X3 [Ananas comosus]